VEQRAGAGPYGLAVVRVDAVAGQHDRVGAGGVGAAQHGAGIAGVADVGEHGDQPRGAGQRGGQRNVERRADRDDALRRGGLRQRGRGPDGDGGDRYAGGVRPLDQLGVPVRGPLR
jgi:hypothetical protein